MQFLAQHLEVNHDGVDRILHFVGDPEVSRPMAARRRDSSISSSIFRTDSASRMVSSAPIVRPPSCDKVEDDLNPPASGRRRLHVARGAGADANASSTIAPRRVWSR